MDGFELNKIFAAVLCALLIGMIANLISQSFVDPKMLDKNAFEVEGIVDEFAPKMAVARPKGIESIEPLLAAANIENGQRLSKKCAQCHTFNKGGKNKLGPNLWNTFGAKIAHVSGFSYSRAMAKKEGKWTIDSLNKFLYKPREFIKGTKMSFAGLKKPKDRADIITFLKSKTDKTVSFD
jgi:cytochrome c